MKSTLKQFQVRTGPPQPKNRAPMLPHERDESEDSDPAKPPRQKIKQAYEDLQNGQVDTDLRNIGGVDEVVNQRPGTPPDRFLKKRKSR